MAIKISKIPKWEGANIDDKLEVIRNSISQIGFIILSFSLMILSILIVISATITGENSIGTVKLFSILMVLSFIALTFSTFFTVRKVK